MGFEKLVNELDVKEAARLGMHTRPLTVAQVQAHLQDLGIDPEFGTHSHIRGLSGETLLCSTAFPCTPLQSCMHSSVGTDACRWLWCLLCLMKKR